VGPKYPIHEFGISFITHLELQCGVQKSEQKIKNQDALDEFLLPLTILPLEGAKLAVQYGKIRNFLESKGNAIGPFDMLIAAHAISLNLTIISNNIKELSRVPNLKCENWISNTP
jgi:tRNA(fMet)-specific endonuclease VapC